MNVTVNQQQLLTALQLASQATSTRSTVHPILQKLLLKPLEDGNLLVSATDFGVWIQIEIPATVDLTHPTGIAVPAATITEYVNALPKGIDLTLNLDDEKMQLELICADWHAEVKGLDGGEFPDLPSLNQTGDIALLQFLELHVKQFLHNVSLVSFVTPKDESLNQALQAVECTLGEGGMKLAATDGFRLSVAQSGQLSTGDDIKKLMIPGSSLLKLQKLCASASSDHPMQVFVPEQETQVLFKLTGDPSQENGCISLELGTQLHQQDLPPYEAIIPKSAKTVVTCERMELLRHLKSAIVFAKRSGNLVTLHAESKEHPKLIISAVNAESGKSVTSIQTEVEGDEIEIHINGTYLHEMLTKISDDFIVLRFNSPTTPGELLIKDVSAEIFRHIIMPMHPSR